MGDHLGSNCIRSQPAKARIAGYTELAWISQRVTRTSSSNPCRFRRTAVMECGPSARTSLSLDVGRSDHLGPFLRFVRDELAEIGGRAGNQRAAELEQPRLEL